MSDEEKRATNFTELAERELQQELAWFLEKCPEPGLLRMIEWWHSEALRRHARFLEMEDAYKRQRAERERQGMQRIAKMLTEEAKHSAYAAQLLSAIRREISGEPK